ncbi:MAG: diacylglycerol kinase family lipid kinase [Chloroflexi bacterium]|nr:MAG: diacylglycerol kinase family lipid kinase [Chloroflexota bacterium]
MKVKVILNPYANRWGAKERMGEVEAALKEAALSYDLAVTDGPGHGLRLAETAVSEGYDVVVAAGGDGTVGEVANGLLRASGDGPTVPLGVLPIGSANDFAVMTGIPRRVSEAVRIIAAGHTRQIDAGLVNGRYFINNSACAMEPMVTLESMKIHRISGTLRYMVALVRALARLKAWQMQIVWDEGQYTGPVYLVSICNAGRSGGFMMAPQAEVGDGKLDFVFAPEVPRRTVLAILLRLLRGTHIHHPQVEYGRITHLSLRSQPGTPVHADGEIIGESLTHLEYRILPGKVTLITPPPAM